MKGRLTLDDFKLNHFESQSELDKMMGVVDVAAACHETCNPDKTEPTIVDWIDHDNAE